MAVTGITILEGYSSGTTVSNPLSGSSAGNFTTAPNKNSSQGWDNGYCLWFRNTGLASGALYGGQSAITTNNCSAANTFIAIQYRFTDFRGPTNLTSTTGVKMMLNSGGLGTEEGTWPLDGEDTLQNEFGWVTAFVNPNRSADADVHTIDTTDITNVGMAINYDKSYVNFYADTYCKITPLTLTGFVGAPTDLDEFYDYCEGQNILLMLRQGTSYFSFPPLHIGDGSTATEYTDSAKSIVFPGQPTFSGTKYARAHIDANDIGFQIDASASDSIDISGYSLSYDSRQYFIITGSSSATWALSNFTVLGAGTTQISDGIPLTGFVFDDCDEIEASQPTLGGTIRNAAAVGLLLDASAGLVNATPIAFTDNVTAIEVDIAADPSTCVLDITAHTFSGNTTDILYSGTGTLTITATSAQSSAIVTSAPSGTIVVSAPVDTFTLNSTETGGLLQIFTAGTQTVLATGTGTQITYNHSSQNVDYVVQKAGFLPQRVTTYALSGSPTITVTLEADPVYDSAHGLTYTTDATYDPSVPELILATRQEGRDFYSLLIDSMIAQSTLFNKPFLFTAVGPDSIFFTDDNEIATGDLDNWKGAGIRYVTTAGATAAEWISLKSSGDNTTGVTGEFQQSDGGDQSDARATGNFDEIVQVYGDASHSNFDFRDHLVCKFQPNPYLEARVDVLDSFGVTALEPFEYVVAMTPVLLGVAAGDPAITLTVVDHTGAPLVVGGKSFDYEIQGGGSDSGTAILREWNYNKSLDATMYLKDPFDWCDAVREAGSSFETAYGNVEGSPTGLHGFYVSRSGADHPDFVQFQSNDGTYYVPAVTANISGSGMPVAGGAVTQLQITNDTAKAAGDWLASTVYAVGDQKLRTSGIGAESTAGLYMVCTTAGTSNTLEPTWDTTVGNTTPDTNGTGAGDVVWTTYAILFYVGDPASASYADSYIEGEEFSSGDTFGIRFAELDGATSFKIYETTGITASTGFSFAVSTLSNTVYASNAIDGSNTPEFAGDYVNNELDVASNTNSSPERAFAAYCHILASSPTGMYQFWGAVEAIDQGNYLNDVTVLDIFFDSAAGTTISVSLQGTGARWYKSNNTDPVRYPTTSGFGVGLTWELPVSVVETGSVTAATVATAVWVESGRALSTPAPTAAANAAAVQASAITTPLPSNAKQMNDATIYGDGTVNDKWTGEAP